MIDSKSDGVWYYQDCVNSSQKSDWLVVFDFLGNRNNSVSIADGPPVGSSDRYVTGYPVDRLVDDSSVADYFRQYDLSSRSNLYDFERSFSNPSIPTEVTIDRDPFDTGFSIWYLVVDVFQLKGLFASLFSTIVQKARFRALTSNNPTLTAKQLANDHLAVKFGLLPTIDDLQKFFHLIQSWQNRYDDLEAFLESTRAWHAEPFELIGEYPNLEFTLRGDTPVNVFGITQRPIIEARVKIEDRMFRRTASYSFSAPEFRGWSTRLKQFMDAFGVLDPAALWDVIPFSFIVDWFYGVGNWLHANRPQLFPASVIVRDYCESKRLKLNVSWYATYFGNNGSQFDPITLIDTQLIAEQVYTSYVRRKLMPPPPRISAPRFSGSGISLSRALISASLIAQRVPSIPR